jgi:hypothetical protein
MDFARQPHHIPFMTGKKPRRQKQSAQLTRALARWESEGGEWVPVRQASAMIRRFDGETFDIEDIEKIYQLADFPSS